MLGSPPAEDVEIAAEEADRGAETEVGSQSGDRGRGGQQLGVGGEQHRLRLAEGVDGFVRLAATT